MSIRNSRDAMQNSRDATQNSRDATHRRSTQRNNRFVREAP